MFLTFRWAFLAGCYSYLATYLIFSRKTNLSLERRLESPYTQKICSDFFKDCVRRLSESEMENYKTEEQWNLSSGSQTS